MGGVAWNLHADVSWPPSELIRLCIWSRSVDFPPFGETVQIWGFRAFPEEHMEGMAWNFACWCIHTTFKRDKIIVIVCWFFLLLVPLWLCKTGQFEVSRHFLENAWEEWPEFWHADVSQPPSELIRFWSCSVDFPHFGAPLTWWNWSYLVFPGIIWRTPGSKCWGESGGIYSMFCVEFCPVFHVKCSHIWWWNFV